ILSFIDIVARAVPEATRRAGKLLFEQGQFRHDLDSMDDDVVVYFKKPESATAAVFVPNKNRILVRCDCDAYQRSQSPCRHIWAALLVGEETGAIKIPDRVRSIQLLPDDEFEELEDDFGDD